MPVAASSSESRLVARGRSAAKGSEFVKFSTGPAPVEPSLVTIRSRCHDDVLEYTHAFALAYARSRFRIALAQPIGVAAYELLSNALNYGSVLGEVVFQIIENPKAVTVRVTNETVQVRLDMLRSHLERVNREPEATFLEEMRRSVAGGVARPMLGLARIVHEAKPTLEVHVDGTLIAVAARAPI